MRQLVFRAELGELMLQVGDVGQDPLDLRFGDVDVFYPSPGELQRVLALAILLADGRHEPSLLLGLHPPVSAQVTLLECIPGPLENRARILEERLDRRPHRTIGLVGGHKLGRACRSLTLLRRQ
jgi:hypothetical protein